MVGMLSFSKSLIEEYQNEMYLSYGVLVSATDAQVQLLSLTRFLFPAPALLCGEKEVGASITPTSGLRDKEYG